MRERISALLFCLFFAWFCANSHAQETGSERPHHPPRQEQAVAAFSKLSATPVSPFLRATGHYDLARYLNVQSAGSPDFSPTTNEIVYLSNVTGTNQVWKLRPHGLPEQLTFFEDRVLSVRWSPKGDLLLFSKDQGGDERAQLYIMDPDGETVEALTRSKAIHHFGDFSHDGSMICYSSNERNERFFDVYVMDMATRKSRLILSGDANYYAANFSPDGKYVLVTRENTNMDNDLFLIEVATGESTHLTPHKDEASYSRMKWAPDGSGFYLGANEGRDKYGLAFFDVSKRKLTYLENEPMDMDSATGLDIDRAGTMLVYGCNHNGISVLKLRNLKSGKVSEIEKLRGLKSGIVGGASFSGDGRRIAFSFTSASQPGDIWIYDVATVQARPITHSSRAGIAQSTFVTPQVVSWESFDRTKISAFLYLPKGAQKTGKLPVIVSVHGGPEGQERPVFNAVYQYFLNRGYAILAPNIRGSAGFGKAYLHMDDYKKRLDAVKDVAAGVEFLKGTSYIDSKKIVIMGGSYGGFMTLAQATMNPDLWAAAVDIVGIANWDTFFKHTGAYRRAHRASEYGDPAKDPEFMASISPINHVDKIKAPLFVIAGANDPRVPKEEADQIVEKVKTKGVPVEYIAFPDEGHGMAKRANRIRGYTAIADFLDKYVKENETGAATK